MPATKKATEPSDRQWVRFTAYTLDEQGVIRPALDAKLQTYDPWAKYRQTRDTLKNETPYAALFGILTEIPNTTDRDLAEESKAALLDWCSSYGLLGLVPHRATLILHDLAIDRAHIEGEDEEWIQATGRAAMYTRTPRGWKVWNYELSDADAPEEHRGIKPGVLWKDLNTSVLHHRDLAVLTPFFPGSNLDWYPLPLSSTFWRAYGEPVGDFLQAARYLEDAVRAAAHPKTENHGFEMLNTLAEGGQQIIGRAKATGRIEMRWRTPSLLASLAAMAQLDLLQAQQAMLCALCQRPYISGAYQSLYCSTRCRHTAQKRNQRAQRATTLRPKRTRV
jgi:hypothetical protein